MRRPTRRLASTPSNLASIMPRAIVAGDSDDQEQQVKHRTYLTLPRAERSWAHGEGYFDPRSRSRRFLGAPRSCEGVEACGRRSLDCSEPTQPSGKDGSDRLRETAGHADGMGTLHSSYGLL